MSRCFYGYCKSKKFFSLIILLLILLAPIINASAERSQVRIGVIAPLTGGLATIGNALKNGIELARSENPALFKNISFIYEDDQYDSKQSVAAYQKLKQIDGVSLVFGFGDALGYSIGAMTDRDRLPLINFNFDAGPARGKQFLIRAMNHTEQYAGKLASYISKAPNQQWSIVQADASFFGAMVRGVINEAKSKVRVITPLVFTPSESDFRSSILKLKRFNTDRVGLFLTPDQLLNFVRQARLLNFETSYFGTDLFETAASLSTDPSMFSGSIYPDNEVSSSFREKYLSTYGNEAQQTFAGSGYDMALLVAELLQANPNSAGEKLMNQFKQVANRPGVLGSFSFISEPEYGMYFSYPIRVKQIQDRVGRSID